MSQKTKSLTAFVVLAILTMFFVACGDESNPTNTEVTSLVDVRDGKTYKVTTIGSQIWMAENLNYETETSICYEGNMDLCVQYGRLYQQTEALSICPAGWRLPTLEDANVLIANDVSSLLATGTNSTGFSALLGGSSDGNMGTYAIIWTSEPGVDIRLSPNDSGIFLAANNEYVSVRCLQDVVVPVESGTETPFGDVSTNSLTNGSSFVDERDGQSYRIVTIGEQTWMAENLNYAINGCGSGDKDVHDSIEQVCKAERVEYANGFKQGCIYTYDEALKACPVGWHLPSENEFRTLIHTVEYEDVKYDSKAAMLLKTSCGWYRNGNGEDRHGFSAWPVSPGRRNGVSSIGAGTEFWSSTCETSIKYGPGQSRYIDSVFHSIVLNYANDSVGFYTFNESSQNHQPFSMRLLIRCLRD